MKKRKRIAMATLAAASCLVAVSMSSVEVKAANPILPGTAFIPDGEPHVFAYDYDGDGVQEERVYIYGSKDERITDYCGEGHDVWSAPVTDMTEWTHHGEVLNVKDVMETGFGNVDRQHFGAPDCVYNPQTGKYYLYAFLGAVYNMDGEQAPTWEEAIAADDTFSQEDYEVYIKDFGGNGPKCFVSESDTPFGPFTNPKPCWWPAANNAGAFDPSALVQLEEDGQYHAYVYWGMRSGDRCAEVDINDMRTIIDPDTKVPDISKWKKTLPDGDLFEASSVKKVGEDNYTFICSSNKMAASLVYYWANDPLGPWTRGDGDAYVVRNNKNWRGGNEHGGIFQVGDQWYVSYHRPTSNNFNRQAMIDPIDLKIDEETGKITITEAEMSSQGTELEGLNPFWRYNINTMCWMNQTGMYIKGEQRDPMGLNPLMNVKNDNQIGFKYFNFDKYPVEEGDKITFRVNILAKTDGVIEVWANDKGVEGAGAEGSVKVGEVPFTKKNSFADVEAEMENPSALKGTKAIYLKVKGGSGEVCNLREYEFIKNDSGTVNRRNKITMVGGAKDTLAAKPTEASVKQPILLYLKQIQGISIKDDSVTVTGLQTGASVKATKNCDGTYNFLMPDEAVEVSAEMEKTSEYFRIYLNDELLDSFDVATQEYEEYVPSYENIGTVTAEWNEEAATCTVEQASAENDYTATVTWTCDGVEKVYKINFKELPLLEGFNFAGSTAEDVKSSWMIYNENPANWKLSDAGMTITTERGGISAAVSSVKNLFYRYAGGDWSAVAKLDFNKLPSQNYQQAGIIIFQDLDNYVKMDVEGGGQVCVLTEINGKGRVQKGDKIAPQTTVYLKLSKLGNKYYPSYSVDGKEYKDLSPFTTTYKAPKFGLIAMNDETGAPGIDATFEYLQVTEKELAGLEVAELPRKVEYEAGEPLDSSGLVVNAVYSDDSKLEITDYELSEVNTNIPGTHDVTVNYKGMTTSFQINVKEPVLTGLEVIVPDKLDYIVGEEFDSTGMVINAIYSNKMKKEVAVGDCEITGFDSETAGEKDITVTYQEMTASFKVVVKEETPAPILSKVVLTMPGKVEYLVGEELDLTGLEVYAHYSDGTYAAVTDYTVGELDTTEPGIKYVTVSYQEMTAEFMVIVAEKPAPVATRIEVTAPDKTVYKVGEKLDTTGMVVTAFYEDESSAEVINYTIGEYDFSTPGEKQIVVTYQDVSAEFTVTVEETVNEPHWVEDSRGCWYDNGDGTWPYSCWQKIDGEWYHFNASGYRESGWVYDGYAWYYCDSEGVMQTGWVKDGNTWYYMSSSGVMQKGWVNDGYAWYYMSGSGAMQTGWVKDGNTWYYMSSSGAMQTGWQSIYNVWYYFYESGAMAHDTWIGNCYVNSSGVWTKTR